MKLHHLEIPEEKLRLFCERNHILKLSLFGSAVRDDFHAGSDVDILVEFEEGHRIGLIAFAGLEDELSKLLNRKVDLNTPQSLSRYFRDEVLAEAEALYVAA